MKQKASPTKGTATDRLTLKRRAMATLTGVRKTERKYGASKVFKKTLSDGELMKRKVKARGYSEPGFDVVMSDAESELVDDINECVGDCTGLADNCSCNGCSCYRIEPNIDVVSCKCFECYYNIDGTYSECISACKCDVPGTTSKSDKFCMIDNLPKFGSCLNTCQSNLIEQAKKAKLSELHDNNISYVTDGKDEKLKHNIDLSIVRNVFEYDVKKEIDESVILKTGMKEPDITSNEVIPSLSKTKDAFKTKTDVEETEIETDTTFVSSLFNPLSSDLDEPIDISVQEDISLDASIDMDDILNNNDTSDIDVVDPEGCKLIPPGIKETTSKLCIPDNKWTDDNNNEVKIAKYDIGSKMMLEYDGNNNKLPTHDMTSDSMFKPAFDTAPKPIFRSIIELASDISPKAKASFSDPSVINTDHTYSKIKKPVHFNMKSVSLKCKKMQPFSQIHSMPVKSLKASFEPVCSYTVKLLNNCGQENISDTSSDGQKNPKFIKVNNQGERRAMNDDCAKLETVSPKVMKQKRDDACHCKDMGQSLPVPVNVGKQEEQAHKADDKQVNGVLATGQNNVNKALEVFKGDVTNKNRETSRRKVIQVGLMLRTVNCFVTVNKFILFLVIS